MKVTIDLKVKDKIEAVWIRRGLQSSETRALVTIVGALRDLSPNDRRQILKQVMKKRKRPAKK